MFFACIVVNHLYYIVIFIKADPKGTFWYHSHVGAQRTNGVFGALIIKERPKAEVTPPIDVIMQIGDWHHESSEEVRNYLFNCII